MVCQHLEVREPTIKGHMTVYKSGIHTTRKEEKGRRKRNEGHSTENNGLLENSLLQSYKVVRVKLIYL